MTRNTRQPRRKHRLILLAISLSCLGWRTLRNWVLRMRGKTVPGTCVVLVYHGVPPEQRRQFAQQMDDLLRWARPVAADFKGRLADGIHHVAVTFDDGLRSFADNALPELQKRGIPSTLFVPAGNLGEEPNWPCSIQNEVVMSAEEVRALPSALVTIGSHTMSHPRLADVDEATAWKELSESRNTLESLLGRPVKLFAFPHGKYNQTLIEMCCKLGYERVFTIEPALAFVTPNEFVTGRVIADLDDWRIESFLKMMGAYLWLSRGVALKRKVTGLLRAQSRKISA